MSTSVDINDLAHISICLTPRKLLDYGDALAEDHSNLRNSYTDMEAQLLEHHLLVQELEYKDREKGNRLTVVQKDLDKAKAHITGLVTKRRQPSRREKNSPVRSG